MRDELMDPLLPHLDHRISMLSEEARRRRLAADRPAAARPRAMSLRLRLERTALATVVAVVIAVATHIR
jgi:hypothetical protein